MKLSEEYYFSAFELRKEILTSIVSMLDVINRPVVTEPDNESDDLMVSWVNRNGDINTSALNSVQSVDGNLLLSVVDPWQCRERVDISEQDMACKYFDSLFLVEVLEYVEKEYDAMSLEDKITGYYNQFVRKHEEHPVYAYAKIQWNEGENSTDYGFIKLDTPYDDTSEDPDDEQILFFTDGLNSLLELTQPKKVGFVILECFEFYTDI